VVVGIFGIVTLSFVSFSFSRSVEVIFLLFFFFSSPSDEKKKEKEKMGTEKLFQRKRTSENSPTRLERRHGNITYGVLLLSYVRNTPAH
jgi:hypothetical protein